MNKDFDTETTYDIQYLGKMWQIIIPYFNLKLWTQGKSVSAYPNFLPLYHQMQKRIGYDYIATATLTKDDYRYIKKAFIEEKVYNTCLSYLLKPISPLKKTAFPDSYSLLQSKQHKEIVENIITANIKTQNSNYENINSERHVTFHTKNIRIILDAFGITVAELDKKIWELEAKNNSANQSPNKHIVSKIINKGTHEIMNVSKLQSIATAMNKIIEEKYSKTDGGILNEHYYDESFRWINIFAPQKHKYEKETYRFYKEYPITIENFEESRILYCGSDNRYYEFEIDWLTLMFQDLNKSQKKMAIDIIYEFLYEEYKVLLRKLIQNILEKHGVSIKEYEEKWGKVPENIPDPRFLKIIISFFKIK